MDYKNNKTFKIDYTEFEKTYFYCKLKRRKNSFKTIIKPVERCNYNINDKIT